MLISMCSCAPGYFHVDLFSIFRIIVLDLVKICNFQLVSHVAQKVFDVGSWNFTGMLISICSCAPGYFCVDIFSILRVIALDLVKIYNFPLVSHVAQKVFDIGSWNFTGILISMWSCASGFACEFICFVIVIALDLQFSICVVRSSMYLT
jgi:hypothetical protein